MTISIERLLTMTTVRTNSFESSSWCISRFNKEDAQGVQAQVQRKHPIGFKVLESKIIGCEVAGSSLRDVINSNMMSQGLSPSTANTLALFIWYEVCGSSRCQSCNGVGKRYSKRYRVLNDCQACCGTGETLLTTKDLTRYFSLLLGEPVTTKEFTERYYDLYINEVVQLLKYEGKAESYAKSILRVIEIKDEL